ncbi:MAG: REP element-mobilizing transposase RayT [Myxococcota bacterium]|jgi:REP element-mobilizing transposase RayT
MNRGARRAPLFGPRRHRTLFVHFLSELPERFAVRICAWVLMPNHYHLLVQDPDGELPQVMRHLAGRFGQSVNALHPRWDGPLFRGRYANRVVVSEAHWSYLYAYIALNPCRAGLVENPQDWVDGGHRALAGIDAAPRWIARDARDATFGHVERYAAYIAEIQSGERAPPSDIDQRALVSPSSSARLVPVMAAERTHGSFLQPNLDYAEARARLTHDQVRTMWTLRAQGVPTTAIARSMGVTSRSVRRAIARFVRQVDPNAERLKRAASRFG